MEGAIRTDGEVSVEPAPPDAAATWNEFVSRRPDSHYGHRYEWRSVVEGAYKRSCKFLLARRNAEVVGVLPLVWMPGRISGNRLVSLPYLDLGGALAADRDAQAALNAAAIELAQQLGARSVELRESAQPESAGTESDRFRFLLALPDSSDALWQAVGQKVRNQVRKARKSELSTVRAEAASLPEFYNVFSRNMRDLGSPVHSRRFLAAILDRFGDDAHLYLTRDRDGRTVAGAIGLRHQDTLTVPWASALRAARPMCPNHSLYWEILEQAIAAGLERFDFGRSSVGTGTYRFKKQWGATPVPLTWQQLDGSGSHPEAPAPAGPGGLLAVDVWRRLPMFLANRIGPLVRGRLPQ